jgi:hypothetical protein
VLPRASDLVVRVGIRVAAIALLFLVVSLVLGWAPLLPGSLVLVLVGYGGYLIRDDVALDSTAPVFAAGLLVAAELGYWSLEEREGIQADPGEALRRVGMVAALGLGALAVSAGLLAAVDVVRTRGLAVDLVGAAAAAATLSAVALIARRPRDS